MNCMDSMDSRKGAKPQRRMRCERRENAPHFDFNASFFAALRLCAKK